MPYVACPPGEQSRRWAGVRAGCGVAIRACSSGPLGPWNYSDRPLPGHAGVSFGRLPVRLTISHGGRVTEEDWRAPVCARRRPGDPDPAGGECCSVLLVERGVEPFTACWRCRRLPARRGGSPFRRRLAVSWAKRPGWTRAADPGGVRRVRRPGPRSPRPGCVRPYLAIMARLPDPVAGTDAADARWVRAEDVLTGPAARVRSPAHRRRRGGTCPRKLENSALATAFCGPVFTISELQRVYEAVWGIPLDPRNFYRKVQGTRGFVVPVDDARRAGAGRPARLFRAGSGTVLNPPMTRPSECSLRKAATMTRRPS